MNAMCRFALPGFIAMAAGYAAAGDLGEQIASQDGWVGYAVPMVANAGAPCCYEWHARHLAHQACELEGRNWSFGTSDDAPTAGSNTLNVYLHVAHGKVDNVRAFDAVCPVKDADRARWLEPVSARDSIATLARSVEGAGKNVTDAEVSALALHADPAATPALMQLAEAGHPRDVREQALFWLAQVRGAEGARVVEHIAASDADAELRANAVFALSEAHGIDAYAVILRMARNDTSEEVRSQALFWMAQMDDARARADILAAIERESSESVREQAVFALSQLKDGQGDSALMALVRGNYPRKVKEQALFWLGESGSDEAMRFLDEILDKRAAKPTRS